MGQKSEHLKKLKIKHRELDQRIQVTERQSGSDPLEITRMKKKKLRTKEEITRVEAALDAELIEEIKSAATLRLAAE